MAFQFPSICTIALNNGNLKFRGYITLVYFEMFLNKLWFLLTYILLAISIIFKLIGSLQLCHFNFRTYARTIALNCGNLKFRSMTLTYFEMMFQNKLRIFCWPTYG